MASKRRTLGKRLKRIFRPTIGKFLCVIVLAYFFCTFYFYSTKVDVSYYEVEEGSLVKEHNYTGLILRNEQIINAEANGYIYFFVADGRKAAKGSPVYSIDEGGRLSAYLDSRADELTDLNSSRIADIRAEILNYSRSFDPEDFRSLYNIKSTIDAHTVEYASMNIFSSIQDDLAAQGISYKQFNADMTGIVCTYTDGYEDITESDINETLFDQSSYSKLTVKAGDLVASGSPAYKMITDENWEIVFPVTADDITEFGSDSTVKLSFSDKGFTVKSKINYITGSDGKQYGVLALDSYVIQFTSDRFINFEIVTNDVSGLKIPDKAVTTKDFYVIPADYLVTDSNGNKGFYKAVVGDDGTSAQFVMPEIFNADDEYCYIDCDENSPLKPGDYVMPDAQYSGTDVVDVSAIDDSETDAAAENSSDTETDNESASGDKSDAETSLSGDGSSDEGSAVDSEGATGAGSDNDKNTSGQSAETASERSADSAGAEADGSDTGDKTDAHSNGISGTSAASGALVAAGSNGTGISAGNQTAASDSVSGLYPVSTKKSLTGAYNVNKGYTVFKKVEILESANGYSIVRKNSSYGLQVYDHIVLDASTVHDGQLLYR